MKNDSLKNLLFVLITIAIIVIAGFGLINAGVITTDSPELNPNQIHAIVIINYGDDNMDEYTVEATSATVYSLLIKTSEENNFDVVAEYYKEFGSHLIESINSVKGEGDMFWQYYVNEDLGMVSADSCPVQDNDIIEWKYEKFEY